MKQKRRGGRGGGGRGGVYKLSICTYNITYYHYLTFGKHFGAYRLSFLGEGGAESAPPCGRHFISEAVAIRVKMFLFMITSRFNYQMFLFT